MSDNPMYDLMRQAESGPAGYNAFNRGTHRDEHGQAVLNPIGPVRNEPITTSSLAEINRRQELKTSDETRLGAVGQYQIIKGTLEAAQLAMKLPDWEMLDKNLQDRVFSEHLMKQAQNVQGYIEGQSGVTLQDAQTGLAKQWASFSDPNKGDLISHHESTANHASISLEASAEALNTLRTRYAEAYRAAVQGHDSNPEQAAWRTATAISSDQRDRWDRIQGSPARPGDTGSGVAELQGELNRVHASAIPLAVNASYDRDTTSAVEAFQRAHHLAADGVAGPKTRLALAEAAGDVLGQRAVPGVYHPGEAATPQPPTSNPQSHAANHDAPAHDAHAPAPHSVQAPMLAEGASGGSVRALQLALDADGARDHHGRPLHADGEFGPRTADAVRSFQEAHGLAPDGIAGRETYAALDKAGPGRHPHDEPTNDRTASTADGSHSALATLAQAFKTGDRKLLAEVAQAYTQSTEGQAWLASGQALHQQTEQAAASVQRPASMRLSP